MSEEDHSGTQGVLDGITSYAGMLRLLASLACGVIIGIATYFVASKLSVGNPSQIAINFGMATILLIYGLWFAVSIEGNELDTHEMGITAVWGDLHDGRFIDSGLNDVVAGIEELKKAFKTEFELKLDVAGIYSKRNARPLVDIDRVTNKIIEKNRLFPSEPVKIEAIVKFRLLRTKEGLQRFATNGNPAFFAEGATFELHTELFTDALDEIVLSEQRVLAKEYDWDELVNERVDIARNLRDALTEPEGTFWNHGIDMSTLRIEFKHVDPPDAVKKGMADEAVAISNLEVTMADAQGEKYRRIQNAMARKKEIGIEADAYGVDPSELPRLEAIKGIGEGGRAIILGETLDKFFSGRVARRPVRRSAHKPSGTTKKPKKKKP